MKSKIPAIVITGIAFAGVSVGTIDYTMVPVTLDCAVSYQGWLYDTPSGNLDPGYYDEDLGTFSTTTPVTAAHRIDKQSHTICYDPTDSEKEKKHYLLPLPNQEYDDLAKPGAGTPQKAETQAILDQHVYIKPVPTLDIITQP